MASGERREHQVITPRLVLEFLGVSLLLLAVNATITIAGLASASQVGMFLATLVFYIGFMLFCFSLVLAAIYYALR